MKPYSVCLHKNSIVVVLSNNHSIPFFNSCTASQAATIGVDITDPNNWDTWDDATLVWNILEQKHEFVNLANLRELNGSTDGCIPFDMATGDLRSRLSLLKFAQDKLYNQKIFETYIGEKK